MHKRCTKRMLYAVSCTHYAFSCTHYCILCKPVAQGAEQESTVVHFVQMASAPNARSSAVYAKHVHGLVHVVQLVHCVHAIQCSGCAQKVHKMHIHAHLHCCSRCTRCQCAAQTAQDGYLCIFCTLLRAFCMCAWVYVRVWQRSCPCARSREVPWESVGLWTTTAIGTAGTGTFA
jgi:hypothetical protein